MATPADVLRFVHYEAAVQNAQRRARDSELRASQSDRSARDVQVELLVANGRADALALNLQRTDVLLEEAMATMQRYSDDAREDRRRYSDSLRRVNDCFTQASGWCRELSAGHERLQLQNAALREENDRLREQLEAERPAKRARKLK